MAAADRRPRRHASKQTKGERTKANLREAILKLVAQKGLFALTLDDICRETSITVGAFYFHFQGKDQAVEETVAEVTREVYEVVDTLPSLDRVEDEIHAIVAAFVDNYTTRPESVQAIYKVLPNSALVYRTWLDIRSAYAQRLERRFREVRAATGRSADSMHMAVAFLLAAMEGLLENIFFGSDPDLNGLRDDPDTVIRQLTALWYRTILGDDPDTSEHRARRPMPVKEKSGTG